MSSTAGFHRAHHHALPSARSLSLDEEITLDDSVYSEAMAPIDVEICGAGAQEYREDLLWWLTAAYAEEYRQGAPLLMGMALSLRENGHVDSILLCAHRRLLIIRIRHQTDRFHHSEFVFDRKCDLARLLYGKLQVERQQIQPAGFHGALQALHIHRATSLHSQICDLSANHGPETEGQGHTYEPAHLRIEKEGRFRPTAKQIAELTPQDFRCDPYACYEHFAFKDYLPMATEALSAFLFAQHKRELVESQVSLIDTAKLSLRDLDLGARLVAVFHSVTLLQPELQRVDFSDVREGEEKDITVVHNERYSTRLAANSRQAVTFTLEDGTVVKGKTQSSKGKKSQVKMDEADRARLLTSTVTGIMVEGREDADRAQNMAVAFWYGVMRSRELTDRTQIREMNDALDPSGLFYPFFYGEEPLTKGTDRRIRKFGPVHESERYDSIEKSVLDDAQKRAAMALAGPLKTSQDRLTMIHGPPGTGKTTVIREFAKQWIQWVEGHQKLQAINQALQSASLEDRTAQEATATAAAIEEAKAAETAEAAKQAREEYKAQRRAAKRERLEQQRQSKKVQAPASESEPQPEAQSHDRNSKEEDVPQPRIATPPVKEESSDRASASTGLFRGEPLFGPDGPSDTIESDKGADWPEDDDDGPNKSRNKKKAQVEKRKREVKPEDIIPSLWCVCQSNAAVKNIAESLKRAGVPFRILVSDTYFTEWHEHQYLDLYAEVVVTKGLSDDLSLVQQRLGRACVLLCTISSLSSPKMEIGKLFDFRPINCLIIDEASQIVNGAYPHLFARHHRTLGRVGFFGDHRQLAPFGSDTIIGVDSAFELRHLRDRATMLNKCYRLPTSLGAFISREVYGGELMTAGPSLSLRKAIRFFDIGSGKEEKGETSFTNRVEAEAVCDFVQHHLADTTLDFKVLAPYTGQRDLLESMLKGRGLAWQDRVFTIDSFQGHEAEIILISLVRDGHQTQGHTVGFLINRRRVNVLLTRSKRQSYVFTSRRFLQGEAAKGRDTLAGRLAAEAGADAWRDAEALTAKTSLLD
ncbi:unnamed protein product [Parajaminaea phylloscopi]